MHSFVRTTGGLLQLRPGAVRQKDIDAVLAFARQLGHEAVPVKRRPAPTPARRAAARPEFQDLQASVPEAFR